jgi:hypothetical protein
MSPQMKTGWTQIKPKRDFFDPSLLLFVSILPFICGEPSSHFSRAPHESQRLPGSQDDNPLATRRLYHMQTRQFVRLPPPSRTHSRMMSRIQACVFGPKSTIRLFPQR